MNDIYLYDTLTHSKKKFEPLVPNTVSMYNCGPTVHNYAHIGNLRSYVFADILRRVFEYNGLTVTQVINITDIGHLSGDKDDGEDKMTKALKRENKPLTLSAMREIADFYFEKFKEDLTTLNIEIPTYFPFASDNIAEDIALIEKLSRNGFTYTTNDGLYFDTSKFADYGKLGNIVSTHEEQSRIGVNVEKRNQKDFAVWKFNSEFGYEAPFGVGFPGWHIECSAMSIKYLGPEFDIHTGGIDHIPVHHNNEIAQAVCAGYPYARNWMHNAFLTVESGKMGKSEGNSITLNTLREKGIDPLAYRYLLLTAHYSSPLQFSWEALEGSQTALKRLRKFVNAIGVNGSDNPTQNTHYRDEFIQHINNNLETPKALALIWEIIKDETLSDQNKKTLILDFDRVLGLELNKLEINVSDTIILSEEIQTLIQARDTARMEKNFTHSDELRQKIEKLGFEVTDTPTGTEVKPI